MVSDGGRQLRAMELSPIGSTGIAGGQVSCSPDNFTLTVYVLNNDSGLSYHGWSCNK